MQRHMDAFPPPHSARRRLVEECRAVSIADLRAICNRQTLLKLAKEERSVRLPVRNHYFQVGLSVGSHRLPGGRVRRSDTGGDGRLWLRCPCGRRARRLYKDPLVADMTSTLRCRKCLGLIYMSQNSGKCRWWSQIARPLRKLFRERSKLLARKPSPRVLAELDRVNGLIFGFTQRATLKRRSPGGSGVKRRYKDVSLLLGDLQW
jgi:hypothetical protein